MNEKNSENRIWVKLKNIQNDFFEEKKSKSQKLPQKTHKNKQI